MSDLLKIVWNVFFKGPEGFKEHFQVEGTDPASAMQGRAQVLTDLQAIGATPEAGPQSARNLDQRPQQRPQPAGGEYPNEMERALRTVMPGAQVQRECPRGCGPMKWVGPGVSRKTGKPYNGFWACDSRNGGCGNTEN